MDVEIVMPEIVFGSYIPAATVCSVQLLYNGINTGCVSKDFINSADTKRINYYQRFLKLILISIALLKVNLIFFFFFFLKNDTV